jgi:hypothetical protein
MNFIIPTFQSPLLEFPLCQEFLIHSVVAGVRSHLSLNVAWSVVLSNNYIVKFSPTFLPKINSISLWGRILHGNFVVAKIFKKFPKF